MASTMDTTPKGEYLSASKVKERGWTDSLIRRLLGHPDATAPNPMFRGAAPVRLYDLEKILSAEESPGWQVAKALASTRSATASQASVRRAAAVVEKARRFTVTLPVLADDELYRRAVVHRNEVRNYREDFEHATVESVDESTMRPWSVNYLRHVLTGYDSQIGRFAGEPGVRSAETITRQRVYMTIATYPGLAEECRPQLAERENGDAWAEPTHRR